MLLLNQFSNSETKQLVWQELSKKVFPKNLCPHFDQSVDNPAWNQTWNQTSKSQAQWSQEGGGGEGLCLHSQEGQDLCACAAAEELIFNTSSFELLAVLVFTSGLKLLEYEASNY